MRNSDGGWPQVSGLKSDPCFTAFAIVALLDVTKLWSLEFPEVVFRKACKFLLSRQSTDGSWTDWHGMSESPDATGNIILALLSCGFISPQDARIIKAVEFICDRQIGSPGGWGLPPVNGRISPLNWVTCYSMLGLQAFVQAINSLEDRIEVSTGSRRMHVFRQLDHLKELEPPPYSEVVNLKEFYCFPLDAIVPFPLVRPLDATMADAVPKYVGKKLPTEEIKKALSKDNHIVVLGCWSEHLEEHPDWFQYENLKEIEFNPPHKQPGPDRPVKRFNTIRPRFYWAQRQNDTAVDLVCAVFPGRDYVLQYASLIRHAAAELKYDYHSQFNIVRYPLVEAKAAAWTELGEEFVEPGDVVVIGYVDELEGHLKAAGKFELVPRADGSAFFENKFYLSTRYRNKSTGTVVNFLGVKFSFWGSISEVLAERLCKLQTKEIIYFAKLGTLTANDDIYNTVFFGRDYFIVDHTRLQANIKGLRNYLAEYHKSQRAGRHVSVPTVLEEDFHQRAVLTELCIETIDNEVSKIARAIETNNRLSTHQVRFSPVHFATDYIRSIDEKLEVTHSDLSKDHTPEARGKKAVIIDYISARILIPYLEGI
ncbi:prenyltransferase/squalene oxidase repeat-containing protein [Methylobacterium mesophilicum]|uniref:prenyltransferase/squalene oxidase repeat-containing protein n=1 Tax=Methylobacterium mesophilicum TaxID=39956 RepID=UPI002F35CB42